MQDYAYSHAVDLIQNAKKLAAQEECSIDVAFQAIKTALEIDIDTTSNGESIVEMLSEISRHLQGIDYEIKNGLNSVSTQLKINLGWIGEEISKK